MSHTEQIYHIFTDGSCKNNKTVREPGACYFVMLDRDDNIVYEAGQLTLQSTNGQEEIRGVLTALQFIRTLAPEPIPGLKFRFYIDALYVVNTLTQGWLDSWELAGYMGRPNEELWKEVAKVRGNDCTFKWVKGHRKEKDQSLPFDLWTCKWNNYVDKNAGAIRKDHLKMLKEQENFDQAIPLYDKDHISEHQIVNKKLLYILLVHHESGVLLIEEEDAAIKMLESGLVDMLGEDETLEDINQKGEEAAKRLNYTFTPKLPF